MDGIDPGRACFILFSGIRYLLKREVLELFTLFPYFLTL